MSPSARPATVPGDPPYVRPLQENPPFQGRAAAIEQLLVRYRDVTEAATPSGPGTGSHVPLTPHAANCRLLTNDDRTVLPYCTCHQRSVRELERLIQRMRVERPSQWAHVRDRYLNCQQATKDLPVKRKAKNGKTVTVPERTLVFLVRPSVRLGKVRRGVQWLADEWSAPFEPMLPVDRQLRPAA